MPGIVAATVGHADALSLEGFKQRGIVRTWASELRLLLA